MSELAVNISQVTHAYGSHTALRNVSFDVKEHHFFGLLGPNGSGKTTLFRILCTLMPPDEGSCHVMGLDTQRSSPEVRRLLGVIFQQPSLDEALTVHQNLQFHGAMYGLRGAYLKRRIDTLAERMGIADRLNTRVSQLSGGLKRRADLIRGLLHNPRLLLLDEPTTGLDPAARHAFWQMVSTLRHEEGLTLILATHLLEEASSCDAIVIMNEGVVKVKGNPNVLRQQLGDKMLWLTSSALDVLASKLLEEFGFASHRIDESLCIADNKALATLPNLYASLGSLIESATIRKPTLEDVFLTSMTVAPEAQFFSSSPTEAP